MINATTLLSRLREGLRFRRRPSRFPDFNLLPEEYRARRLLTPRARLLLIFVGEVLLFVLVLQARGEAAATGLQGLQARFFGQAGTTSQVEELQVRLEELRTERQTLIKARTQVEAKRIDWAAILTGITRSAPEGLKLASLRQSGQTLTLTGTGPSPDAVLEFRSRLRESEIITDAILKSLIGGAGERVSFVMDLTFKKAAKP